MPEDYHDKTEDPTPKRLAEARKKGYVAKSKDLIVSFHLIACLVVFYFFLNSMAAGVASLNVHIFSNLNYPFANLQLMTSILREGLMSLLWICAPMMIGGIFIALLMNVIQTGFLFSLYPLAPNWSRLNLFNSSNYENSFGAPAFVKLFFGLIRLQIVLIMCVGVAGQRAFEVFSLGKFPIRQMLEFMRQEALVVGFSIATAYLGIAFCDYMYQNWLFKRKMRMSKREVRDEIKQVEGDRTVKNKIFASMKNLSEASIAKKIAESDALIVGGDHIAVAIRYIKGSAAPFCTGKGIGRKAVNMIEIAKTHGVPALNSPALARKLYLEVQLDSFIPPEYYRDIAQILSESYSKGKTI